MSVIDPALSSLPGDEDSDWEYEYDDNETETFFLNLDLTSQHGVMRPPRRRNHDVSSSAPTSAAIGNPTSGPLRPDEQDPSINPEPDNAATERIQVLGLHTHNPIISYQNQIFTGTWADQIGTELFFARPDNAGSELDNSENTTPATHIRPLKHTDNYDLLAANSVKILGRKANLISSSGPAAATEQSGPSTADTSRIVYKPAHQSNQARFLERLQQAKDRKGETDTVRKTFSTARRVNIEDRPLGWQRTEEQLIAIQQLNARAAQGDLNARMALDDIHASLGSQHAGPNPGSSH